MDDKRKDEEESTWTKQFNTCMPGVALYEARRLEKALNEIGAALGDLDASTLQQRIVNRSATAIPTTTASASVDTIARRDALRACIEKAANDAQWVWPTCVEAEADAEGKGKDSETEVRVQWNLSHIFTSSRPMLFANGVFVRDDNGELRRVQDPTTPMPCKFIECAFDSDSL
jgi:hypothetical protein